MTTTPHPETLAIRSGRHLTRCNEHSLPLFLTSSFLTESAEDARQLFAGEADGYTYSRFTNPTVNAFEERLAALEGGERCQATASGMAAIHAVLFTHLSAGDHVVASRSLFGATYTMLATLLPRFGIEVSFVEPADLSAWQAAIRGNTRLFFLETPSNPQTELTDIAAVAGIAHAAGALLVVDNCFCSPALQTPLALGADLVVHSGTKYIDGQGRVLGGAVVGSDKLIEPVYLYVRTTGPTLSAFNAWVLLSGLETLFVRMERHCASALKLATWLEQLPQVRRVRYPGLPSHPQFELARRQQRAGGAVIAFELDGGREAAWKVVDAISMISRTGNFGDVKSTLTHPATTTHGRLAPEVREAAGITEGLLRLSVGLEHPDDIQADLLRGLA
ncbi:O-succinylhomoserine sulfhydrylase [Laribacter hongkongensis]|uniref:O-succinylhomoserine sulfhydrylase n=1 Tax=Laribacter hongkongensis TaxID=168471 RepID=UPI001EFE9311|nr:O-succinylhomoserine sulfhydrylase [Laribacter hongkongensis]MCG8992349.1 O-succinylhomoserine sulfhydrylase [Laribacter hongkongensis]MCG8997484.1 O-succinylhomoserine sulfhydrylase [Laribacter hongkongensis]MCG9000121.1 O-succinylhomoserine sulfhydrylase [Laribacter hongkongensis]MCG9003631.1 O-succinylhomoserine sulfhydrylase [Laribacter hongkongensis]MCG9006798.1 O-succinylhomoserine sulfhydrylase [Laribacter hongkongensis]